MFAVYGDVQSAEIVRDIISGESRGYGFIEMRDEKAAQTAIAALDQTEIDSLFVTVRENRN
jgi:RNA recognition motif-containing protein